MIEVITCLVPLSKRGNTNFENFKKEGNPNFENFKKEGNLRKSFAVGETKKDGKDFQKQRENPTI